MFYEARIKIVYEEFLDQDEFIQEYNSINYHKNLQDFKLKASRLDFSKEEAIIFELLCDIKKDLLELKDLKRDNFLNLKESSYSTALDYNAIKIQDKLKVDTKYYCRLTLVDKIIAIFAKAIDENTLEITSIKRFDEESFNHFIADTQRHLINMKKDKNAD